MNYHAPMLLFKISLIAIEIPREPIAEKQSDLVSIY